MGIFSGLSDILIRIRGDASELVAATDEAKKSLDGVKGEAEKAGESFKITAREMIAVGGAMTAAGAAILKLTDDARKMNADLGVTALQIGATEKEMRDLALATADVSFPLEDVSKTFDLLARAGVRNKEEMQAIAKNFDVLGDAIGVPADQLTSMMIPALNAFGIPLKESGEHLDSLTHLFRNTTIGTDDFSRVMTKLAPDIRAMGLSMDDVIAILEDFHSRGIQGRAATSMLSEGITSYRKQVEEGTATQDGFLLSLGISAEKMDVYRTKLSESTGMTEKYAEAANKQFGIMDQAKSMWSEFALQVGSAIAPLEGVGAVLGVVGPIMMGVGGLSTLFGAGGLLGGVAGGAGIAGIGAALLPILPIVAAVAAAAFLLYEAWTNNWFGIQEKTAGVIEWLQGAFENLVALAEWLWSIIEPIFKDIAKIIGDIIGAIKFFIDWLGKFWDALKKGDVASVKKLIGDLVVAFAQGFANIVKDIGKFLLDMAKAFIDIATEALKWGVEIVVAIAKGIMDTIYQALEAGRTLVLALGSIFLDMIKGAIDWGMGLITNFVKGIINNIPFLDENTKKILTTIVDTIGSIPAKAFEWGRELLGNFIDGIKSMWAGFTSLIADWMGKLGGVYDFILGLFGLKPPVVQVETPGWSELAPQYQTWFPEFEGPEIPSDMSSSLDAFYNAFADMGNILGSQISGFNQPISYGETGATTNIYDISASIEFSGDNNYQSEYDAMYVAEQVEQSFSDQMVEAGVWH